MLVNAIFVLNGFSINIYILSIYQNVKSLKTSPYIHTVNILYQKKTKKSRLSLGGLTFNFVVCDKKMRINYKKRAPNAMYFTKKILNEYPFGHIQATVYGPKRIGKTIYILLAQMDAYKILYPDKGVDWRFNKAMSNTIYTIKDLIKKTEALQVLYDNFQGADNPKTYIKKSIEEGIPEIMVHIDDGGVGFNKYIYFSNREIVEELKNYMDTVGIVITGLPISTPSLSGVLGFIRQYEGYNIHIIKRSNDFRRIAKIYKTIQLPDGKNKPRRPKNDPYNCWLPTDLYRKYKRRRGLYLKRNIKRLKEYQKKRKDNEEPEDKELNEIVDHSEETVNEYKKENII